MVDIPAVKNIEEIQQLKLCVIFNVQKQQLPPES